MKYESRVSIPSAQGKYRLILHGNELANHIEHQHTDNANSVKLMILTWSSLLGDSTLGLKPELTINRFVKEAVYDLFGLLARFSSLNDRLISSIAYIDGDISVPFILEMRQTPIFKEYLHFYRTRDVATFQYILSFLNFGKKIYYKNPDLDRDALRAWIDTEERIGKVVLPSFVANLKAILEWIFTDFDVPVLLPKHGGGAVAEKGVKGVEHKNRRLTVPTRLHRYMVRDAYDMRHATILLDEDNEHHMLWVPDRWCTPTGSEPALSDTRNDVARLMFVPKSWKASRSICMEPAGLQYAQQGVRLWLEHYMSENILRNHVDISDQTVNQSAAQYGSRTRKVDTVDLKSASDCVLWTLIKLVYPAEMVFHFAATRSTRVALPDGHVKDLQKFAPMGSGLCFPAQTSLYSAIVLLVEMCMRHNIDWRDPDALRDVNLFHLYEETYMYPYDGAEPYFKSKVYGDDIACNSCATSNIVECLESLGFVVNREKSFTDNQCYRESCGEHYLFGERITPYKLKTKEIKDRMEIDSIGSIIDAANLAGEYGYTNVRKTLIQFVLHCDINRYKRPSEVNEIAFSDDPFASFSIYHINPRNTHLRRREYRRDEGIQPSGSHTRFQRMEVYRLMSSIVGDVIWSEKFDQYRYNQWWRSRINGREAADYAVPSRRDVMGARPVMGWSPYLDQTSL